MEWGNFWSSHLPRTSYDIDLDADSPNPNDQVSKVQLLTLFIAFTVVGLTQTLRFFDTGF